MPKQPLNALIVKEGEGRQDAVAIDDHIFMSRGISNSYLVTTDDGHVQINMGMYFEADEIKRRFGAVSDRPLKVIIFTQEEQVAAWAREHLTGPDTIIHTLSPISTI